MESGELTKFRCPSCNQKLGAPASMAGKGIRCECGTVVRVPPPSAAPLTASGDSPASNTPAPSKRAHPARASSAPRQPAAESLASAGTRRFQGTPVWEMSPIVLEGLAGQAGALMQMICAIFRSREIDDSKINLYSVRIGLRRRQYLIASWHRSYAYIYVHPIGKDLYVSWFGYYKGKISLLALVMLLYRLPMALAKGGTFLDALRKDPDEFQEEDISKFASAIDHWMRYTLDRFLEKVGWDAQQRSKRLATSGVSFTPRFKKA